MTRMSRPYGSLVIHVAKPSVARLSKRIREICEAERLKLDARFLSALYEMTEGDIRACLNLLQFSHRRYKHLSFDLLHSSSCMGQKDIVKGSYPLLVDIFQAPDAKREARREETSKGYLYARVVVLNFSGSPGGKVILPGPVGRGCGSIWGFRKAHARLL